MEAGFAGLLTSLVFVCRPAYGEIRFAASTTAAPWR
jgi:hypothetical protein